MTRVDEFELAFVFARPVVLLSREDPVPEFTSVRVEPSWRTPAFAPGPAGFGAVTCP